MAGFHTVVRIQLSGVQDIQLAEAGYQLRPQIVVHFEGVFRRVGDAIFVIELQHEPLHAAVEVKIDQQRPGIGYLRRRKGRV